MFKYFKREAEIGGPVSGVAKSLERTTDACGIELTA
jgi:hypothetical protein